MAELPTRFYVQRSQLVQAEASGWDTVIVTFDEETAKSYADGFQRSRLAIQGVDVTESSVTVARVITAEQLREEGEDALIAAEMATRVQFWQILAEWAAPLSGSADLVQ